MRQAGSGIITFLVEPFRVQEDRLISFELFGHHRDDIA